MPDEVVISDEECWNLYMTIAEFVLPRLRHFKEGDPGHPGALTQEEWHAILDDMIFAFDLIVRSDTDFTLKTTKTSNKRVDKGLRLFAKWFEALWW